MDNAADWSLQTLSYELRLWRNYQQHPLCILSQAGPHKLKAFSKHLIDTRVSIPPFPVLTRSGKQAATKVDVS